MLVLLSQPVYGATVTLAPRASASNPGVTIKTNTGYANATVSELFNSQPYFNKTGGIAWTTANFDVSKGTALLQGTYTFQISPFGNGTFQLRFFGPAPQKVVANASAVFAYSNTGQFESINYTTIQNSQLVLVYTGVISFGVVGFSSSLFGILMAAVGSVFIFALIGLGVQAVRPDEEVSPSWLPRQSVLMIIAVVAVVGFVLLLLIGASLVNICPSGYTCTG